MKKLIYLFLLLLLSTTSQAQLQLISGVEEGSYYRLASDIKAISKLDITVSPSAGSEENFEQLLTSSQLTFAFLQYDVLWYKKAENESRTKNIQIVLPLDCEEIHLLAYKELNINSIRDLKGKKVAIGSPLQGTNITARMIKKQLGIEWEDVEIDFNDALVSLLSGSIDAFFFVAAAPVTKLKNLSPDLKNIINLVSIEDPSLDQIYQRTRIRAFTYKWSPENIATYSVRSMLAVNVANETPENQKITEQLIGEIKDSIQSLQSNGHSKWRHVDFSFRGIDWTIYPKAKEIFRKE